MENQREQIHRLLNKNKLVYAEKIVNLQYADQPGLWQKFGASGKEISIRDAGYHLPFLAEAVLSDDQQIFKDYVAWVKVLFQGLHFPDSLMISTLEFIRKVLNEELPADMTAITSEFIDAGIEQMQQKEKITDTYIDETTDMGKLAKDYISALLSGNRNLAGTLIMDAVKNGTNIKNIYLEVFQKSQYEVGRLWLNNKISVAKEHFCSAATQMIMSQLYPYIFSGERIGKKFVGACIGGELHEIGIRMVADFFEMEGWDTYYLGANAPVSGILNAAEENEAQVVGLSIAMPFHRSLLKESIEEIRKSEAGKNLKILIGGVALKQGTDYNYFKADGWAPDARAAVEKANQFQFN